MNGNTGDVFLKFVSELRGGGDVLDRNLFKSPDDGRRGFELRGGPLCERSIELSFISGGETHALGLGNDLHDGMFELG